MTLTEFLTARLAEDEAMAKAACEPNDEHGGGADWEHSYGNADGPDGPIFYNDGGIPTEAQAAHIARQDPARVLREVEAKRKILADHGAVYPVMYPQPAGDPTCGRCHEGGFDYDPPPWPCDTVLAIAAVWSDHPDYDPAWA